MTCAVHLDHLETLCFGLLTATQKWYEGLGTQLVPTRNRKKKSIRRWSAGNGKRSRESYQSHTFSSREIKKPNKEIEEENRNQLTTYMNRLSDFDLIFMWLKTH